MMDDSDYYKYPLGIKYAIPSTETLRQRFDLIGDSLREDIQQANIHMLHKMHIEPFALDNGISVNINVTPFNNSKSNKDAFSALTRGLMAMRRSRLILARKNTLSSLNSGLENSIAKRKRRIF